LDIISTVVCSIRTELHGFEAAEKIRVGFEVAILGQPNAGKSTLLNALAGRDAAIVSEIAGTTRDVIEVRMDIRGLSVTLLDTAGVRVTDDVVESLGVERALERAKSADLRVFLGEVDSHLFGAVTEQDIFVASKADLREGSDGVSGLTGQGVPDLLEKIFSALQKMTSGAGLVTRERHRVALVKAAEALNSGSEKVLVGPELFDLAAEDVRISIRAMESLVGRVDVEAVLDEIFSSFCLGK
jgi:tRNA modification GTPase